jgi:transposase
VRNCKTERRLADRARSILWKAGWVAVDAIAERLDIHRDIVITWRRRFPEGRQTNLAVLECLCDRPRSGRPPQFSRPMRKAGCKSWPICLSYRGRSTRE